MWASDRATAEDEAVRRYGEPCVVAAQGEATPCEHYCHGEIIGDAPDATCLCGALKKYAAELRLAVRILEACIATLEGRDGADVLTDLGYVQGLLGRVEDDVAVLIAEDEDEAP
jgi:hypothetical protein